MKLAVITGSIRQGRVTHGLAQDISKRAAELGGVEVTNVDLKDLDLPFFDEAISPKFNPDRKTEGAVKQWLDALATADAYVLVSPEYNKSIPGALKNAIDFIAYEVSNKPVALASHGSSNGGYSLGQLRIIVSELGGVTIPRFIGLPYGSYDSEGNFSGDVESHQGQIDGLLTQLKQYSDALASVR